MQELVRRRALPTDAADLSEAIRTATRLMEATLEMKPLEGQNG